MKYFFNKDFETSTLCFYYKNPKNKQQVQVYFKAEITRKIYNC